MGLWGVLFWGGSVCRVSETPEKVFHACALGSKALDPKHPRPLGGPLALTLNPYLNSKNNPPFFGQHKKIIVRNPRKGDSLGSR